MIDLFRILKLDYKEYVILFKSGSFYVSFDEDATILNNIFNYKIVEMKNNIKVGFPLKQADDNLKTIKDRGIYYIIVENKQIIDKYNNGKNKYKKYVCSVFDIISFNNRINKINERIKAIDDVKIRDDILLKIESILDKL